MQVNIFTPKCGAVVIVWSEISMFEGASRGRLGERERYFQREGICKTRVSVCQEFSAFSFSRYVTRTRTRSARMSNSVPKNPKSASFLQTYLFSFNEEYDDAVFELYDYFYGGSPYGDPHCGVSGFAHLGLSPVGIPRKLPPASAVEFACYKNKYSRIHAAVHPAFFAEALLPVGPEFRTHHVVGSVIDAQEQDRGVSDGVIWRWQDVSTEEQLDRFYRSYGWTTDSPRVENFCCIIDEDSDGSSCRLSAPFVVEGYRIAIFSNSFHQSCPLHFFSLTKVVLALRVQYACAFVIRFFSLSLTLNTPNLRFLKDVGAVIRNMMDISSVEARRNVVNVRCLRAKCVGVKESYSKPSSDGNLF